MHTISRKSEIKELLAPCISIYHAEGVPACVKELENRILSRKVKFPLLEYCAHTLYNELFPDQQIDFCDQVEQLNSEGGNVILGIVLQNRLNESFHQSMQKATEYISHANAWYVCDIIGERVFGFSLLNNPKKTLPEIEKLSKHQSNWVLRSLGAGTHYAIKKGLSKDDVKQVFPILLSMANTKDKEIRQGVGWAAKTTAKFHPDVIELFQTEIQNKAAVANWFRAKIDIGLNRSKYGKGN